MSGKVVVGYDETVAGERALALAAHEAVLHRVPLEIVNVAPTAAGSVATTPAGELAEWIVEEGEQTVHELHPELLVEKHAAAGRPEEVLAGEAHQAELLVLGDRSDRGFGTLRDGAVTVHSLDRATCPVLVLSPVDHGVRRRMSVAVDLEEPVEELLGFAFAEAARRGAALQVLNVCDHHATLDYEAFDEDEMQSGATMRADRVARLDQAIAPWLARYPTVETEAEVRTGSIGEALVEVSCEGDLLVVGGRRHPYGRPGMEIGPAVHTLLHHAECPVAVVPIG
jgi:nucleotide-binding universal stress UspA family protein